MANLQGLRWRQIGFGYMYVTSLRLSQHSNTCLEQLSHPRGRLTHRLPRSPASYTLQQSAQVRMRQCFSLPLHVALYRCPGMGIIPSDSCMAMVYAYSWALDQALGLQFWSGPNSADCIQIDVDAMCLNRINQISSLTHIVVLAIATGTISLVWPLQSLPSQSGNTDHVVLEPFHCGLQKCSAR